MQMISWLWWTPTGRNVSQLYNITTCRINQWKTIIRTARLKRNKLVNCPCCLLATKLVKLFSWLWRDSINNSKLKRLPWVTLKGVWLRLLPRKNTTRSLYNMHDGRAVIGSRSYFSLVLQSWELLEYGLTGYTDWFAVTYDWLYIQNNLLWTIYMYDH